MIGATLKLAIRALHRNLLRTLLTTLGMIIGVAAVIASVSLGTGAKVQVESQIASLGQNVVMVLSGQVTRGGFSMGYGSAGTLTKEDFDAVRREVSGLQGASPEVRSFAQVAAGSQNINTQVLGVGSDYLDVRAWPCVSGGSFGENEVRNASKVALIGRTASKTLFGEDVDPVGQTIRIKSAPFTIVGFLQPKGMNLMGSDQDDIILVPYTSAMKRLSGATTFRSFLVQAKTPDDLVGVQQEISEILRQRHKIGPGREDDFIVRTQQEIAETATATSRIMTIIIGVVASVSLIVGGIGIMNIMLVSVTERTREIGVRLAVGARGWDVLFQFLTESIVLSLVGGLVGIGIGVFVSQSLTQFFQFPTVISVSSILVAFGVSASIGIVFGFYPALKASRLDPIDALRYE
ncbi:MAG: FtsX-like permease family protein [Verrucomicrobia bacterium]|nr:MAG: FtsX-like permease family protein [Verrucomicrobiota bacterium]